jgi:hypothetical protein
MPSHTVTPVLLLLLQVLETLVRIKRKDPVVYQKDVVLFPEESDAAAAASRGKASSKPVYLRTVIAKQVGAGIYPGAAYGFRLALAVSQAASAGRVADTGKRSALLSSKPAHAQLQPGHATMQSVCQQLPSLQARKLSGRLHVLWHCWCSF